MESDDIRRNKIKEVIQSGMYLQFKDHGSLKDVDIYQGVLSVVDHKLDMVVDQILEITQGACGCNECSHE